MKKITDDITPELREQLKDLYIIIGSTMVTILPDNKPTVKTLKIYDLDWQISLTAKDFGRDRNEFTYEDEDGNKNYIDEDEMPEEVVKLLKLTMNKRLAR